MESFPSVYSFSVEDLNGQPVSLADYAGQVLLIVNTASACGLTPQYAALETLYQTYREAGFTILAFPSNDFAGQEPLEGEQIQEFCDMRYRTTFPVFNKIPVTGTQAHPLFQFLADKKSNGRVGVRPYWNFHKYLIDRHGQVRDYFFSFTAPDAKRVSNAIEKLLQEPVVPGQLEKQRAAGISQ